MILTLAENAVTFPSEKMGGCTIFVDMGSFLDWMNSHFLISLKLGGAACT